MQLPELLVESPRMLVGLRSEHDSYIELTVFRSPWVRNTDPLFQKIVSEVESRCVTVVERTAKQDPGMMLGRVEEFVVRAWAECPGSDHLCCQDSGHVENVFTI